VDDERRVEKTKGVELVRRNPVRNDKPPTLSLRERINRRYSLPSNRMPNGDPGPLTLWGEE
jgi:hypothetical protein